MTPIDKRINDNIILSHDLRVEGWLDAPNVRHPLKGLFRDEATLREQYPAPVKGWMALVGETLPANVYVVEKGQWVPTGKKGGQIVIQIIDSEGNVNNFMDGFSEEWLANWISDNGYATEETIKEWVRELVKTNTPDLSGYVDTENDQTIRGKKTFTALVTTQDINTYLLTVLTSLYASAISPRGGTRGAYVGREDQHYLNGFFDSLQARHVRMESASDNVDRKNDVTSLNVEAIASAPLFHFEWRDTKQQSFGTTVDYWKQAFPSAVGNTNMKIEGSEPSKEEYLDILNLAMACCIVLAREVKELIPYKTKVDQLMAERGNVGTKDTDTTPGTTPTEPETKEEDEEDTQDTDG